VYALAGTGEGGDSVFLVMDGCCAPTEGSPHTKEPGELHGRQTWLLEARSCLCVTRKGSQ
jgi:hypothetical protein